MREEPNQDLKWIAVIALVILGIIFLFPRGNPEVNLCRSVFSGLVRGDYAAQKFIDWNNLKAVGVDVGAAYSQLPGEREKLNYRQAFIKSLSMGFNQTGAKLSAFTNWRVYDSSGGRTIIAADVPKGTRILFTFLRSPDGKKRLTDIQWKEPKGADFQP